MLEAAALSHHYVRQHGEAAALKDVSFGLRPGERALVAGPNGAGKSTLIKLFAGLLAPSGGRALIDGAPAQLSRARVGVVGHATYLYPELTLRENLRLYATLYRTHRPAHRAAEVLALVGAEAYGDEPVERLSRGQQQRGSLARALLHDPPILLLDEPDTGLDVAAIALLRELVCHGGRTVLMTTHNLAVGLEVCNRVLVLVRGGVVLDRAVTGDGAGALAREVEGLVVGRADAG